MKTHFFRAWTIALAFLTAGPALAQTGGVGIGTATPHASAALEVSATTKGLLPPRLSQAQRDAIASPATGLTLYNTTTNALNVWNGTAWTEALSATAPAPAVAATLFAYTGGAQTYTVPAGVVSLLIDAVGGQGGGTSGNGPSGSSGRGGRVQAVLSVTPGEVLTITVGGQGGTRATSGGSTPAGYNGGGLGWNASGGGGGATDIRRGGTALANRILVAGGGGGQGENDPYGTPYGGAGGGLNGADGGGGYTSGRGGTGGSQTSGGYGSGALGLGGAGDNPGGGRYGGGGGGGGYYGGGGGYYGGINGPGASGGAGGGGSSWVGPGATASAVHTQGYATGNGTITLTPGGPYPAPVLNGGNLLNVPTTSLTGPLQAPALVGLVPTGSLGLTPQAGGIVFTDAVGLQQNSGQLFWNSTANYLGLGTSAPGQRLEVAGSVYANGENGGFLVDNQANARVGLLKYNGREAGLWRTATQDFEIGRVDAGVLGLPGTPATWTTDLYVSGTGTVGIGTAAPTQKLEVAGQVFSSTGGFRFPDNTLQTTAATTTTASNGLTKTSGNVALGGTLSAATTVAQAGFPLAFTGGNVGIGTTSPSQKLEVNGNALINSAYDVLLRDPNAGLGWYGPGKLWNGVAGYDGPVLYGYSGGLLGTNNNGTRTTALAWNSSGQVGIGTSTPTQQLDVAGGILARSNGLISNQGAYLQWNRSGGLGETWLLNQKGGGPGGIFFGTSDNVSSGTNTITEWARFDSNGNLGLGTTSPGQKLTVIGAICASLGVNCSSDGRYKKDVVPVQGALASVLKLRGVTYYWRQAEFPEKQFPARRQLGFIAQEIEPYYPEMVTTDADGYKSLDYARLTPVLVEALKEQQAQIDTLKVRAATAEAKAAQATATTDAFEARLRALEAGVVQARK